VTRAAASLAVIAALASCGGGAPRAGAPRADAPPSPAPGPTVIPDDELDVEVGTVSSAYAIEPGVRTIRFRVRCDGQCVKVVFLVQLVFPEYRRPPVELALRQGDETVATRASGARCWEDDVHHDAPPTTCTAMVAHGWIARSVTEPRPDVRVIDLVIDNRGPARAATMIATVVDDPPR
jgi:hypothetical protein